MEHRHTCVYCRADWWCYEGCPLDGASVCDECRGKLLDSPETPRRVVALDGRSNVLSRLAEYDAARIREELIRRRPGS